MEHLLRALIFITIATSQGHANATPLCQRLFSSPFQLIKASPVVAHREGVFQVNDENSHFYFKAKLENGRLSSKIMLIDFNEMTRSSMKGSLLFEEMVQHFGLANIQVIEGRWFGFSESNYQKFMRAHESGKSMEEAAFETWTGKQAKNYGFDFVEVRFQEVKIGERIEIYVKADFSKNKIQKIEPIKDPIFNPRFEMIN